MVLSSMELEFSKSVGFDLRLNMFVATMTTRYPAAKKLLVSQYSLEDME